MKKPKDDCLEIKKQVAKHIIEIIDEVESRYKFENNKLEKIETNELLKRIKNSINCYYK